MVDETADHLWASADSEAVKTSPQLTSTEATLEEEVDPDSCGFMTLYQGMQVWHFIDIVLGVVILIYGSIMAQSVSTVAVVLIIGSGIVLTIRGLCGTLSLGTEDICHRCGLSFSAGASPIMACTWFVLMFINLILPGLVRKYLQEHHMLWKFLQNWENSHKLTVTLLLFGVFLLECARWQLVLNLQRKVHSLEAMEDSRANARAARRNRMTDRPWWCSSINNSPTDPNDPLTDALLPVTAERSKPQQQQSTGWYFLGRPKRTQQHHVSPNVRQDGSGDFASIQDDWVGRTNEDPFWWSREDDSTVPSMTSTEEVSWAKDSGKKSPARR
ncbi:expressed unknown protein [Seminavis robusta]|uniref:Transmembrane protein n=1 Tax=Seminavis robusta TaxID=568900 RepID=A0A9N8DXE1_9STRA|nr:expressed unknown protein [Seminavis robusta]|eukprot:Sro427_g140620.1 n/a (329) ;mRNA; f:19145-20131